MKALPLIYILTFLFTQGFAQQTGSIPTPAHFKRVNTTVGSFAYWLRHTTLKKDNYLQTVFSYAGTLSLNKQLKPVAHPNDIVAGDVFVQGGSPGHAVIVMDLAINATGEKRFLLAQSYMPAQSIHILKNPQSNSPWYSNKLGTELATPEWVFRAGSLSRWP